MSSCRRINEARNFLKHADRDPDHALTLEPDRTDFLIFDAALLHLPLALTLTTPQQLFLVWLAAKYPTVPLLDWVKAPEAPGALAELRRAFPALVQNNTHKEVFRALLEKVEKALSGAQSRA